MFPCVALLTMSLAETMRSSSSLYRALEVRADSLTFLPTRAGTAWWGRTWCSAASPAPASRTVPPSEVTESSLHCSDSPSLPPFIRAPALMVLYQEPWSLEVKEVMLPSSSRWNSSCRADTGVVRKVCKISFLSFFLSLSRLLPDVALLGVLLLGARYHATITELVRPDGSSRWRRIGARCTAPVLRHLHFCHRGPV